MITTTSSSTDQAYLPSSAAKVLADGPSDPQPAAMPASPADAPSTILSLSATAYALSSGVTSTDSSAPLTYSSKGTVSSAKAVAPDLTAPAIKSFSPTRGAVNVKASAKLAFGFSEKIQFGSGAIAIKDDEGNTVESFEVGSSRQVAISGKKLTIDPTDSLLKPGTRYTVSFDEGSVKDLAGNELAADSSYQFTTQRDRTAPKLTSFAPTRNAKDVALDANLSFSFSEAVKFGAGIISLKNADGEVVESFDVASSGRISIGADGKTLTIDPTADLASNVTYSVSLAKGSIEDLYGNKFAGSTSRFTTQRTGFNIDIAYSGSAAYKKYFNQAKAIWEKAISGDLADANGVDDLKIKANVGKIDGSGKILGQSTPNQLRSDSRLPYTGTMKFDSADLAAMAKSGTLLKVIVHEMGHVLGIGSLWSNFGLNTTSGQYTGTKGLAMYRELSGDAGKTYVPLETQGGSGTANAHWSESVFKSELMTGYATGGMELSKLTLGSLEDLGYQVNYSAAESYTLA